MFKGNGDCCKYQDEIKRLEKKKSKRKKKNKNNVNNECEDFDEIKTPNDNFKKHNVSSKIYSKFVSKTDEILGRIKPDISTRDEYSHSRHMQCVAQESIERLGKQKKFITMSKERIHSDKSARPLSTKYEQSKGNKKFKKNIKKKDHQQPTQENKQQSWSISSNSDILENSECDEICSFDSEIDLSGLTLTTYDRKKIAENVKSKLTQENGSTNNNK